MIAKFFIQRPILSFVISLVITAMGAIGLKSLPIEQYPQMTPPMISVATTYAGASAETLATTVAAPLEQAINGVENMIYMFSQSTTPGNLKLSVYFDIGTDPNKALTNVQNRINLALSKLPIEVQQKGVLVDKEFPSVLLFISIEGEEGVYDDVYLNNYANIQVANNLQRIKGVSSAVVLNAQDYSMRIWLRPDLLSQSHLTTSDVVNAVKAQNASYPIGQIGQEPNKNFVDLTLPISSKGRLKTVEDFEQIVIRSKPDGSHVLLKDVANVELGSGSYDIIGKLNKRTGAYIAIKQVPGSNALEVADSVKESMKEIASFFPPSISYKIPYDTTDFIKISIKEVQKTLIEAAILVALVILLFLHNMRATLVPVIAMIVSILGTFIGMKWLGFSVNTLSLFGMVLSIGIVVDDAIVVVENVERNMTEFKLSVKEAALKTMKEVSGPVIAIVFVLCSVFIPIAFIGGIPGHFYKQFAVTISISVLISGFVALTLSPVLCIYLFKHQNKISSFSTKFNHFFDRITKLYIRSVHFVLVNRKKTYALFFLILISIGFIGRLVPTGFVPKEDQGMLLMSVDLPDGASLARVEEVNSKVVDIVQKNPAVEAVLSFSGYSLIEGVKRTSKGTIYVALKDWKERKDKKLSASEVISDLSAELSHLTEANILVFAPPDIPGIDVVGGFSFWLIDNTDTPMETLESITQKIIEKASKHPEYKSFIAPIKSDCLQLYLDLDINKILAYKVRVEDVYNTLQALLGSVFVNFFNKYGKTFQVVAQADPLYREKIQDIGEVYVRSSDQKMIPLKSLVQTKFDKGSTLVSRFNGSPASMISIIPGQGDLNRMMSLMEEIAKEELLPGMSYSWGGLAYQQKKTGGMSLGALLGGFVLMFLVLASLYERWGLPLSVIMSLPFAIFGALVSIYVAGLKNDIYFQIGLITLLGLSAKNAILIVEFAKEKVEEGMGLLEATLEACRLRFRAILMTSLTFIFGVLPLVISQGAGAASRHSVGSGVAGGMLITTLLSLFFVPLFYMSLEERYQKKNKQPQKEETNA
ncbi:MAG: efflux RND transporter permease subunit [Rhabdochlamydiaceae bacterium]